MGQPFIYDTCLVLGPWGGVPGKAVQEDMVVFRPQACTSSCCPEASPEASVPCFLSPAQVICKDWSNLAGKSYIILNMTENIDCVSAELAMRRGKGQREVPQQGSCGEAGSVQN